MLKRFSITRLASTLAGVAAVLLLPQGAQAACDTFDYQSVRTGLNDTFESEMFTVVLRQGARVYSDASGGNLVGRQGFNSFVFQVDENGRRAQVRSPGSQLPIGWMDKTDLLCNQEPLKDASSGIERKAYIRTETTSSVNNTTGQGGVTAFEGPELQDCGSGGCRELSRFELYFVMDETADALLLSENFIVNNLSTGLIGWIDKKAIIPWNTALAIRPRDDLVNPAGERDENGRLYDGAVCGYPSRDVVREQDECIPILGGKRWYKLPVRLPVIERDGDIFKVAAAFTRPDSSTVRGLSGNFARVIDPTSIGSIKTDVISSKNNLDVFFLIDGTASMEPWIEAIRGEGDQSPGVVQKIITLLKDKLFTGVTIRFGLQVFTDTNDGGDGLGNSYFERANDCSDIKTTELDENHRDFQHTLEAITTRNHKDDYPENLYGGLNRTLRLMGDCPNNTKMIFVIGDAGYSEAAQRARGKTPIRQDSLTDRLERLGFSYIFFIRTPQRNLKDPEKQRKYDNAWKLFRTQAKSILDAGPDSITQSNLPFFIQLPPDIRASQTMLDDITKSVQGLANPQIVREIEIDLRGGASLQEVIERLQQDTTDFPLLWLRRLQEVVCKDDPEICQKRVHHAVDFLYVPADENVERDVWLRANQLNDLQLTLQKVSLAAGSGRDRRKAIAINLVERLGLMLRTDISWTGESMAEFAERNGGIPPGFRGPLLAYSPMELAGRIGSIADCEITLLSSWVRTSLESLSHVRAGDRKPLWEREALPSDFCPTLSDKGQNIPFVSTTVRAEPLGDTPGYSYHSRFRKDGIYWVPSRFLP